MHLAPLPRAASSSVNATPKGDVVAATLARTAFEKLFGKLHKRRGKKKCERKKEKLLWLRSCGFRLSALCLYQEEHVCGTPWQQIINEAP